MFFIIKLKIECLIELHSVFPMLSMYFCFAIATTLLIKELSMWGFQQSTLPISISRVNQVDAARLDVEMSAMLKEQLVKVFLLMKVLLCMTYCSNCVKAMCVGTSLPIWNCFEHLSNFFYAFWD